jgi:hypothetical protein
MPHGERDAMSSHTRATGFWHNRRCVNYMTDNSDGIAPEVVAVGEMASVETEKRATIAIFAAANAALLPLYANLITVLTSPSTFDRDRSFQLALGVALIIVMLLRWRRAVGLIVNGLAVVAAVIALFWSEEPLMYLAYTLALTIVLAVVHAFIYFFMMRKRA